MAVLDWFTKKKKRPQASKPSKKEVTPKPKKKEESDQVLITALRSSAHQVLRAPHVTEKSSMLVNQGKYVFTVFPDSNAVMVRKAIEEVYKVDVTDVHMISVSNKKRRRGRYTGISVRPKKAIITLKKGQTLEILPQ